jgi:acid phosphatase type 7
MSDLTRRRFLQTASILAGGAYANSLFADGPQAAPVFAPKPTYQPTALFLTWQKDPTTTMTIQWVGDEKDAVNRPIWYSKQGTGVWQQQTGNARRFPMTNQWVLRTELTGLEPDTDYRFRVGLDSAEERFRTMPAKANDTIHFVSGGDSGVSKHAVATNHVAAAQSPMFVVMAGDIAYEDAKSPQIFLQFLKNYSRDLRDSQQRLIPLLGGIGNHEVLGRFGRQRNEAPFFYSVFDGLYPDTGFASLDFGDYLSLIFLDTDHTTPVAGAQTDWLEKTLKAREECPTVFAFNHVPAYPSVRDMNDKKKVDAQIGADARKHWVPLFERYNVDAVFEHHDHSFKRTHPLFDGRVNERGIVYLGDGSWGKIDHPDTPAHRPYLAAVHESYHLSVHRIEGRERFHVALSDVGQVVDVCMTTKRDHRRTT